MSKQREFWIDDTGAESYITDYFEGMAKPSENCIHVREFVPIDWAKVWKEFEEYCSSDKCTHLWPQSEIEIQRLVEAQLRGEE